MKLFPSSLRSCSLYIGLNGSSNVHLEKYYSFQIERSMVVVTVFLLIINQTEFRWVHNQKDHRHYDHIPFNFKGIIIFVSVHNWTRSVQYRD